MEFIIALLTLTFLEIILGVDNIIFVSIVTNKLPESKQRGARILGLGLSLVFRIILLIVITWLIHQLTAPFFPMENMTKEETLHKLEESTGLLNPIKYIWHSIGVRELILFFGGLFLLGKSVSEIHQKMEGHTKKHDHKKSNSFLKIILQIILIDIVFSFDSILTAIGITENIYAMVTAVSIAMVVMLVFSGKISKYIAEHPTLEILALSFLILIGFMLILEGVHFEVPKGYIYFAVFFSLLVEVINLKLRKKRDQKIKLTRKVKDDE
ncbi:MAG: TerC family protein [Bacteroidota bacterium]|nr:TerC family protein [Bacteroidota bacterium]